jgi:hypothetical protein
MPPSKDEVARELVAAHFKVEPGLRRVYRILSDKEADPAEPIKLLEVNASTVSTGSVEPFAFAPTKDTPFPMVIAEVSPEELAGLEEKRLPLPAGWSLERAEIFNPPEAA